jgi:predicted lipoprotein with Yx(FWY)xxD motif
MMYRIKDMEHNHDARASGDYPELEGEVALANSAYKMKTFYEWVKQEKKEDGQQSNWNQVSLGKLLTGRL